MTPLPLFKAKIPFWLLPLNCLISTTTNRLGRTLCFGVSVCDTLQLVASQIRKQNKQQLNSHHIRQITNWLKANRLQTQNQNHQPQKKHLYLESCLRTVKNGKIRDGEKTM
jgi:hypothetical protein